MTKLLKIRFVKFEKALVAQQLEITGKEHFTPSEHVVLSASGIDFAEAAIWLSCSCNINIGVRRFYHNDERDKYLDKVVKWISEEQFATSGKLEVGKMCEVSDDNKCWQSRILLAILPERYDYRFITNAAGYKTRWLSWLYARPVKSCVQPTIDGDVYTWEMEVSDER